VLTVPIPILTAQGDIRFPQPGFNRELGIYCDPSAPEICKLDLEEAKEIITQAH
jgi:hypothetical protein